MKTLFLLLSYLVFGMAHAAGTAGVGNGGDPLYYEFEDARHYAATRIANAVDCAFSATVPSNVRQWILQNQAALSNDILQSNYVWTIATQPTCGFTTGAPGADVLFSSTVCRPEIKDITDAIWMVVHESVLHFGFADDIFPTDVASAIADIGINSSCVEAPSADPFDPASCPGTSISSSTLLTKVGLPNTNSTIIGDYNVYVRRKACYSPEYCTPWTDVTPSLSDLNIFSFNDMKSTLPPTHGILMVDYTDNTPEVILNSDNFTSSTGYTVHWTAVSQIDANLNLNMVNSSWSLVLAGQWIAYNPPSITGWMTQTCLRQTVTGSQPAMDSRGNSIINYYEAVILGHLN